MRRPRLALIGAVAAACAACGGPALPTAAAVRGEFVDWIQVQGEVRAARSLTLRAPMEAGQLRIIQLVANGAAVKAGDVIAEFDTSTVARTVDEKRTEVNGLTADVDKARAEAVTREAESVTAETTARYDLERARLDYSAREVLSRVDAEQRRFKVLDAEQKLRESSAKLASVRAESRATISAATQKTRKAQRDLDQARTQLSSLRIIAPADGVVNVMQNQGAPFTARQLFKPGDQVWPGAEIAELPDPSSLYVVSRADEIERGRLAVSQRVRVRVEGLPDRDLRGHVRSISPLAKTNFTAWPPPRNFDLVVALEESDVRLRPGMTASVRIAVDRLPDAILIPSESVFDSNGEEVVFVVKDGRPERRRIEIDRRSTDRAVVRRGVAAGEHVSLVDPTLATESRP